MSFASKFQPHFEQFAYFGQFQFYFGQLTILNFNHTLENLRIMRIMDDFKAPVIVASASQFQTNTFRKSY